MTAAAEWGDLLASSIAGRLGRPSDTQDRSIGLFDLGVISVVAQDLRGDIARDHEIRLSSTAVFEHPTTSSLARHLAGSPAGPQASQPSDPATPSPRTEPSAHVRPPARAVDVVGMACRFPGGAESPTAYWSLIRRGGHVMDLSTSDRAAAGVPGSARGAWDRPAGFLTADPAVFDAERFGISPREVRSMDPQHRLLLEITRRALEDADIPKGRLRGRRVGVWVGVSTGDYAALVPRGSAPDAYAVTGVSPSLASGRIAHCFGLSGPALTIDTACSSSLVAVQLAMEALRAGIVDMAIVGGVNFMLASETTAGLAEMGALSERGRADTFGTRADGYARGEGCGVLVLTAGGRQEGGDREARASLLGAAVNHDGVSAGLTVPTGAAQEAVIAAALADAGIAAEDVDYVEAHGTGTPLGDPIELRALCAVFDPGRRRPLDVGSVKSQIGHLEAAAGIAGLIKAVLMAQHGHIPGHPEDIDPTPHLEWSSSRLGLARAHAKPGDGPLICGVSSFGFSGTNAHVVVSGPGDAGRPGKPDPGAGAEHEPLLILVSGRSAAEVDGELQVLVAGLSDPAQVLADRMPRSAATPPGNGFRFAAVAQDSEEAVEAVLSRLESPASRSEGADVMWGPPAEEERTAWLFSGVGAQWKGMVRHLSTDSLIGAHLAESSDVLRGLGHPSPQDDVWHRTGLHEHLHPVITAVQMALSAALESLVGRPDSVVGYSAGSPAALAACGHLGREDALRIAAWRGRILDQAAGSGATAACGLSAESVHDLAASAGLPDVAVASVTGTANCTVSGPVPSLDALERLCRDAGAWWLSLSPAIPFHHPGLRSVVKAAGPPPAVHWHATSAIPLDLASGTDPSALQGGLTALAEDLCRPADLRDVARRIRAVDARHVIVEIAPQPTLAEGLASWFPSGTARAVPSAVPGRNPSRQLRRAAAAQWMSHGSDTGPDDVSGAAGVR